MIFSNDDGIILVPGLPNCEIVAVPEIGSDPSVAHEYEIELTPELDEGDGKGRYRLPQAACKCGWWKPAKTVEKATEFGEYHCDIENRKPKGYDWGLNDD